MERFLSRIFKKERKACEITPVVLPASKINCSPPEKLLEFLMENAYDISLLENEEENVKKMFIENSLQIYNNLSCLDDQADGIWPRKNLPLVFCILPYFFPKKPPREKFLLGCGKITRLNSTDSDKRDVYLFADETHSLEGFCDTGTALTDFIMYKQLQAIPKFVDIFVETSKDEKPHKESQLASLGRAVKRCGKNREITQCSSNARYHYIDIRDYMDDFSPFTKNKNYKEYIEMVDDILKIYEMPNRKYKKFCMDLIDKIPMLKKEVARTTHPQYIEIIIEENWQKLKTVNTEIIRKISAMLEENKSMEIFTFIPNKIIIEFLSALGHPTLFVMDLYLICRIFKRFSTEKTYYPPVPRNIIVYAGSAHTRIYEKFFQKIGYKITEEFLHVPNKISCVDISKMRLPLFS